ncbi:hypothetical protein HED60_24105 [Planctomycetales bacterium ZRK34]|nr:hypothetical protein HED60_24105 [Planctomycetales bacterium ZRK34]
MTDQPHIENIGRYFDGDLTAEASDALRAALRDDAELRTTFVACAIQRRMLDRLYDVELNHPPVAATTPKPMAGRNRAVRVVGGAFAAAAAVALVVTAWLAVFSTSRTTPADSTEAVAVLTDVRNAVWGDGSQAGSVTPPGSNLSRGHLALVSGRSDLMMTSGAQLALVGDCRFDLTGPNGGYLRSGLLMANVPPQAQGFSVRAPHGVTVIDLGTRFSMFVDEGGCDVLVSEGQVVVKVGKTVNFLQAGQSMRLGAGGKQPQPLSARRLARLLPPVRYVHIGFDESARAVEPDGSYTMHDLAVPQSHRIDGPFGQAMRFDGTTGLDTDLPGVIGDKPRTFAAWVRIPKNVGGHESYAVMAWGAPDVQGGKWQVGWNQAAQTGVLGALRCEVQHGWIIGTTDLRDGKWHHLAVTFDGDNIDQARIYIDGKLDPPSHTQPQRIDTRGGLLQIGHYLNEPERYFRGDLDELYLIEAALTPRQIKRLMRDNRVNLGIDESPTDDIPTSGESE